MGEFSTVAIMRCVARMACTDWLTDHARGYHPHADSEFLFMKPHVTLMVYNRRCRFHLSSEARVLLTQKVQT